MAGIALNVLDEACDDEECLDCLISKQPANVLLQMGKPGRLVAYTHILNSLCV